MRIHWPRFEFRVELASEEPWVALQLHDLDKITLWRCAADDKSALFESASQIVVELVAVPVPLGDVDLLIRFVSQCVFYQSAGIGTQSHGTAFVRLVVTPLDALGLVVVPLRH